MVVENALTSFRMCIYVEEGKGSILLQGTGTSLEKGTTYDPEHVKVEIYMGERPVAEFIIKR